MLHLEKSLRQVDWNFTQSRNIRGIHSIHPYPAKFIPNIPQQLINLLYPGDSTAILDPFAGSGTTLVEAANAGIDAYGIDLHPLACLISKVKTTPFIYDFSNNVVKIVNNARNDLKNTDIKIPDIPRLDHWFEISAQKTLAVLIGEIQKEENIYVRDALRIALSSIIVRVSNQESDTRYAAKKNNITVDNILSIFEKSATNLNNILYKYFNDLVYKKSKVEIINRDILLVKPKEIKKKIGLVITSPPYPNAYEYWLYHKYRMYWLGMDPIAVKQKEIGARPHYFKKNPQNEQDFENQMDLCFELLSEVMIPKGLACFVIGRSIIHGREINNVELIIRSASSQGFDPVTIIERTIPSNKKTFNPLNSTISQEHLVILSLR